MKKFLRLSDGRWPITELDLDPLCIKPSPNFRPNETEYAEPRHTPKPEIDVITQTITESHPVLVDGIWTQQWEVCDIYNVTVVAEVALAIDIAQKSARSVKRKTSTTKGKK